jgi:hypothetical protein
MSLKLPLQYEAVRERIEQILPPIKGMRSGA